MIDLTELEKLAKAATPKEWIPANQVNSEWGITEADEISAGEDGEMICRLDGENNCVSNQAFIAAANPQVVLELIAKLKTAIDALEEFADLNNPNELDYICSPDSEYMAKARAALSKIRGVQRCPPHEWSKDGERCLKCGDKDWMTG